jgi:hypothetical protein
MNRNTAPIIMVAPTRSDNVRVVSVRCPFCARIHRHAWGPGRGALPGRRHAHCGGPTHRSYWIDKPKGTTHE